MADPVVRLDAARIAVDPGGKAELRITVTNPGERVEGYRLEVLGDAAPWSTVTPDQVSVYPQQTATAVIVFSPPAGLPSTGGPIAFGVIAQSRVESDNSAVAEGDLDIQGVIGLQATIMPATSAGRWRGYHNVMFSNWGNASERLKITATNPDDALGFLIKPPIIELPLGTRTKVKITVRARKPFLLGSRLKLGFVITGDRLDTGRDTGALQPYAELGRPTVQGTFDQKPILSRFVVVIGTALIAAIVAAVIVAATRHSATPALPNAVPPTPELVATATGSDSIRLSWKKIELVQGYTLLSIDPQTKRTFATTTVDADLNQSVVSDLKPATEYCYQLQAVRPNLVSRRSNLACATTASPSPTPQPTPTTGATPTNSPTPSAPATPGGSATSSGSTSPATSQATTGASQAVPAGQWIAVGRFGDNATQIQAAATKLNQHGLPSGTLDGPQYPHMITNGGLPFMPPGPVAYAGPYATAAQANQVCAKVESILSGLPPTDEPCLVVQPGQQQ